MEKKRKEEYNEVLTILTNRGERDSISERCECGKDLILGPIPKKGATFEAKVKDEDGNESKEDRSWVPVTLGDGVISLGRVLRFPYDGGWGTASVEDRLDKLIEAQKTNNIVIKIKKYAIPKDARFQNVVPMIDGAIRIVKK